MAVAASTQAVAAVSLCPADTDPCVIGADVRLPSYATIDVGNRALVFAPGVTVTIDDEGDLLVLAGSVTLGENAKIVAPGTDALGGYVDVRATGAFVMAPGSQIDVEAYEAGEVSIDAEGDVVVRGRLRGRATSRDGGGAAVTIESWSGDVRFEGADVDVTGGDRAVAGLMYVEAGGDVLLDGSVSAKGDSGEVELVAGGTVHVTPGSEINVNGVGDLAEGGFVGLGGDVVTFEGSVLARGSSDADDGGGSGGLVAMEATNDLLVGGSILASGGSPDGYGGDLRLTGSTVLLTGTFVGTGARDGDGGEVEVIADGDATLAGSIDVRAGIGSDGVAFGGEVIVDAWKAMTMASGASVLVSGSLLAGVIDVDACMVSVESGARLENLGTTTFLRGRTAITARGAVALSGLSEASGANVLTYYGVAPPVVNPDPGTTPPWSVEHVPTSACCFGCPTTTTTTVDPTTTSTSTSSSTTTSTTSTSTSTSSSTVSTTTSTSSSSTTTSSLPQEGACLDEALVGLDAVACVLDVLGDALSRTDDESLGGSRPASALRRGWTRARKAVAKAVLADRPNRRRRLLSRTARRLASLDRTLARLDSRGRLGPGVAALLRPLLAEADARVSLVR